MYKIVCGVILLTGVLQAAPAQYSGWQHSGSIYLLTTPQGANLPATASENDFPLLVRLDKDFFDFRQAKANGEDIRFAASTGSPLAYQIDQWDAAAGKAGIWVRMPAIKGNARQEIKVYWGKADAKSESSGPAVFNESNGYLSVWHMNDPVKDEVGTVESKDTGTTSSSGIIGKSRRFDPGKGINCGEKITTYPSGSNPHSSEAWFKAEQSNAPILGWGNDHPQGKVIMQFFSPPHIQIECWFSGADVRGESKLPLSQWVHVVHTFKNGDSRIYVNGVLDGVSTSTGAPLAIKSPARMYIGGWYNNFRFVGDLDEVRISKVTRSADWVKLEYENQKPMQTLVGPVVPSGTDFSVSEKNVTVMEGKSAAVSAKAGGAQKVYWIIKRGGQETLAAIDRFHFTLDAGRVAGDQSLTLQFKAVYDNTVKTLDIPVTVREDIPEPVFTLKTPAKWDGREMIEVVPQIANMGAMQMKGAGKLTYTWTVSDIAVIKEITPGKLLLKRSQNSGKLNVKLAVSNGGVETVHDTTIIVKEPAKEAWIERTPEKNEKPVDNQFYARDDKNEGTLYYNGTLTEAADSVFLKLHADEKLIKTESRTPKADRSYAFAVKLKAGLIKYKVEFGIKSGSTETLRQTVNNLVCGDAYIIDGQSNAVAYNYANETNRPDLTRHSSPWIRSFGGNGESGGDPTAGGWGSAVVERLTPTSPDRIHFIGVWGMAMAKKFVEDQKIPICILNGSVGGTRIDQHMPDPANHYDTANGAYSIYGRLLTRVAAAKLTHGISGVMWHQGEADQGSDGPDNCFGCDTYQQYFVDLSAAWKQDMPNIRHYYLFQIWPNSCSQGGNGASDRLRDVERRLPRLYSSMSVISTLSLLSGACHFNLNDYEKMGHWLAALVARDTCGKVFDKPITSPDLKKAYYTSGRKDEIALEFDQPMAWHEALTSQFYLDGKAGKVVSGAVSGNVVRLKLAGPADAKTVTYLIDKSWDIKNLLYGQSGIAALTFCEVPILPAKPNL